MLRIIAASLLLVAAAGDAAPIALDDIEQSKSARLMKNREDIDAQSTFHEDDIKGTGDVPDELSARLVRNRGPITAKVTAFGTHKRYCAANTKDDDNDCTVEFSLVAWKFAGDGGAVRGLLEEKFANDNNGDDALKVDVDCMARTKDGKEAIVGGSVTTTTWAAASPDRWKGAGRRAYVKVVDRSDDEGEGGDFISDVRFFDDDGVNDSHCGDPGVADGFAVVDYEKNAANPRVSMCSKHRDWEQCLQKAKAEQAKE